MTIHHKKIKLSIEVEMAVASKTGIDVITTPSLLEVPLNKSSWDEGRYSYDHEHLEAIVNSLVKSAIESVAYDFMKAKYPEVKGKAISEQSFYEHFQEYMIRDFAYNCAAIDKLKFKVMNID